MPVTYRVLDPEEWNRLLPITSKMPAFQLPEPGMALCVAAEEDGLLLAVLLLQPALHMEPLIISPSGVGKVNFLRLASTAEAALPPGSEYFCFSTSAKVGRMCEMNGMAEAPHHIWRKAVSGPEDRDRKGVTASGPVVVESPTATTRRDVAREDSIPWAS